MEALYLYDTKHFRHIRQDANGYEIGETIYNADNHSKPIRKTGNAPCEFRNLYYNWLELQFAIQDLIDLGFKQVNQTLWIRESI